MTDEPLEIKRKLVMAYIPRLYSDSWFDRYQAAKRIGDYAEFDKDKKIYLPAIKPLMKLTNDSDTDVRRMVARALGFCGDPSANNALIVLAKDPSPSVRYNAIQGLGQLKSKEAKTIVHKVLKDPSEDPDVRGVAAWSLTKINGDDEIIALRSLWEDLETPGSVRLDCKRALDSKFLEKRKTDFGGPLK